LWSSNVKPRISVVTLAVEDLDRSMRFYRDGMGLQTDGVFGTEFEHGAVVFYNLQGGLILATWECKNLAWETGLAVNVAPSGSIGHAVSSREEVDSVIEQARAAGARIVVEPQDTFWGGYAGYFQDPDGHL
jgi:catechol 2,3-dioxygenase-like lactoylglutathione lyase family enzyme